MALLEMCMKTLGEWALAERIEAVRGMLLKDGLECQPLALYFFVAQLPQGGQFCSTMCSPS